MSGRIKNKFFFLVKDNVYIDNIKMILFNI